MSILKKFDHIGIIVDDLEQAMEELSNFFGLECQEVLDINDASIRIAFYALGSGQMEFIEFKQPIDGVDSIVMQSGNGVQHVAFQVEDFKQTVEELSAKGLKLVKGFPRKGAHGQVAFFYPTKGLSLLIEICES